MARNASVIYAQREQLIISAYIGFLALFFAAFMLYMVENGKNPNFDNVADALWWGVVTLCTVGYGDRVPVTWLGKLITCIFTILGVSIFALPAGIIGTGLALKVQEEVREQQVNKRKEPAATLIQSAWRIYASNPSSLSIATWTVHKPVQTITNEEKNAIRFIRAVKHSISKSRFKQISRDYDTIDVMEHVEHGHNDILTRIKNIQVKLNSMLGLTGTHSLTVGTQSHADPKLCITSRLANVEEAVQSVVDKLDKQERLLRELVEGLGKGERKSFRVESCRFDSEA